VAGVDYGSIIHRSWEITWKNKWLWVYGLVLAALGGGGSNFGSSGGGSGSSSKNVKQTLPPDTGQKASHVLGAATTALQQWITHVPLTTWILLGLGLAAFGTFALIVNMIVGAWAKGALIAGLKEAENGHVKNLIASSKAAKGSIRNLIIYGLLVLGITLVVLIPTAGIILFGFVFFRDVLAVIWGILAITVGGLWLILAFVMLGITNIYAERLVVLYGFTPWAAWKRGLSMGKRGFLSTLVIGIINSAVSCTAGCLATIVLVVIFGIPAFLLALPVIAGGLNAISLPFIGAIVLLVLLFFNASLVIRAILNVFNYSNWNLLFEELCKEEEI
jgi:hypothetical protein